jgi:hypothetical protein
MEDLKKQLIDRLKQAQNVLVTVSKDPSIDQLAAAIGLTIALNNMGKHGTAVFSGKVPSTLEFLKPEDTLEQNTDSLRDFIIALDKSKADKLRYKVEDDVVRIFITPYKTSVSEADLEFSQGDFNVDVVVALGVQNQQDLDDAIQAHGRILHDALVASVTVGEPSELGTLNVVGTNVSSLSEMVAGVAEELDKQAVDSQVATAFLTGIVAVTDRFSNEHTTAETMSISSALMAAGANQQLISSELAAPTLEEQPVEAEAPQEEQSESEQPEVPKSEDGTLEIDHKAEEDKAEQNTEDHEKPGDDQYAEKIEHNEPQKDESENQEADTQILPEPVIPIPTPEPPHVQIAVDENGNLAQKPQATDPFMPHPEEPAAQPAEEAHTRGRTIEPPTLGGTLTANTTEEPLGKSYEEATLPEQPANPPLLSHDSPVAPPTATPGQFMPPEPLQTPQPTPVQSLPEPTAVSVMPATSETEASLPSSSGEGADKPIDADEARKAVEAALNSAPAAASDTPLQPITALNAQPLGDPLHENSTKPAIAPPAPMPSAPAQPFVPAPGFEAPTGQSATPQGVASTTPDDPDLPPPVPPPMIPPLP